MRIQAGIFGLAAAIMVALQGCEVSSPVEAGGGLEAVERLSLDLCSPSGTFTAGSTNPYFPLPTNQQWILEGEEGGVPIRLTITVQGTKRVAGVTTRVVEEKEEEDGVVIEISKNYYAQASNGTVCYFGEDVDIFHPGEPTTHEGAWLAEGSNRPGIIMPAEPRPRLQYQMEDAPLIAEDEGTIVGTGPVTVPAARYTETIRVREYNPLDGGRGYKVYAKDVGLIVDDVVQLVSTSPPLP